MPAIGPVKQRELIVCLQAGIDRAEWEAL